MVFIRPADRQDASAICSIIHLALGDDVQLSHVQGVIVENAVSEGDHLTLVAETDELVGFIDGFITVAADDTIRWELDLLGVHPARRGQKIGRQLVTAFYEAGRLTGAEICRALVAEDNHPMHRVMRACGFRQISGTCHLYVSDDLTGSCAADVDYSLLPVKTLTYSGIWVEREITPAAIRCAKDRANELKMDVVGCVVAESDRSAIRVLNESHFSLIGHYTWWARSY